MKQGYLTVVEYEKVFSRLSEYAPEQVLTVCGWPKRVYKKYLTAVTSLQVVNFYHLVQAAMKIGKSEMMSRERKTERKFSSGGSSSSQRARESHVESVHSVTTRGRWQGPTMTPGSSRGTSTRQKERPE